MMLEKSFPPDVDLLKFEVPTGATPNTPWRMTRLARHRYYLPFAGENGQWEEPYLIEGRPQVSREEVAPDTTSTPWFSTSSSRSPRSAWI